MVNLFVAALLLGLLWWLFRRFAGRPPEGPWIERLAEVALGLGALLMLLRGRLDMALLLGAGAAALLAARSGGGAGLGRLKAHLDRRLAGRREHADRDRHARPPPVAAAMSEEQAYEVLGLAPGADDEAVLASHRRLVKRVHPDQGGSADLASRVNQARDVLLSRHRR